MLLDEVTHPIFFGVTHTSWIYDGRFTACFIVEDIRILLDGAEDELLDLKHICLVDLVSGEELMDMSAQIGAIELELPL